MIEKKNVRKQESAHACLLKNNLIEEPEHFVFLNTGTLKPT